MATAETQEGKPTSPFQALADGMSANSPLVKASHGAAQILKTGKTTPMEVERGMNEYFSTIM